jgi:hypothetical protein
MSSPIEGLQFPVNPATQKPSTSQTGKAIISEALSLVDHKISQQAAKEKDWRKNYPTYFKALVELGIEKQSTRLPLQNKACIKHIIVLNFIEMVSNTYSKMYHRYLILQNLIQ